MSEMTDYFDEIGEITKALENLGLQPVLVGGMALVILGSERVTRDFDFVIAKPDDRLKEMLDVFYDRGLELVSKLGPQGKVISTIDNRNVARIRLQLDQPSSIHLFNPKRGLRVDLLFDFPLPATELAKRARKTKVLSQIFPIASDEDLLQLKEIAYSDRASARDAQDLEFLKARQKTSQKHS